MNFLRLCPQKIYISGFYKTRNYNQNHRTVGIQPRNKIITEFLSNYFGLSSCETVKLLKSYPTLCSEHVDVNHIIEKTELLKQMNFTPKEILRCPTSLLVHETTLKNRLKFLEESCFKEIQIHHLCGNFLSRAILRTVSELKKLNYIDKEANVPEALLKRVNVNVELLKGMSEDELLVDTRTAVLSFYFKAKLGVTNKDFTRLLSVYYDRVKTKSFQSIVNVIDILQNQLHLSNEQIINNGFLLTACADNIIKLLSDVPEIAELSIKEIIKRRPAVAMKSPESIKSIIQDIKSFDIPDDRILKCLDILLLNRNTVHERLTELTKNDEFKVHHNHPRILHLVVHQNMAKERLNYFEKLGVKRASINVLSCSDEIFKKYEKFGFKKLKNEERNLEQNVSRSHEKNVSEDKEVGIEAIKEKTFVAFYRKLFDIKPSESRKLLAENPALCSKSIDMNDSKTTADFLNQMSFSKSDILTCPTILLLTPSQLKNRQNVLNECSFDSLTIQLLNRFISLMNKNVVTLKALNYLNNNLNVHDHLVNQLDVKIKLPGTINDDMSLRSIREIIVSLYLAEKLHMRDEALKNFFMKHPWLQNRSLVSLVKIIDILRNKLNLNSLQIIEHGQLFYACPENFNQLLSDVPTIGEVEITEILLKKSQIGLSNVESVKSIINHVKDYNISEESIVRCPEILTLKPSIVKERLAQLMKTKDVNLFCVHPNILQLVYHYNNVKWRLDMLKQVDAQCTSFNVLTQSSESFEKFVRNGFNSTKGQDVIMFISDALKMNRESVRKILIRHPNWQQTPLASINATLVYLRNKQFTDEDIRENLFALLYPVTRIDDKLNDLLERRAQSSVIIDFPLSKVSNIKLLNICIYLIEKEFHFSGDGSWEPNRLDQNQDQNQDLCLREIPEFFKKDYRSRVRSEKKQKVQAIN